MKTNRSFLLALLAAALVWLAAALVWLAFVLASCSTTRPHGVPYVRTDGTRVGASKQGVLVADRAAVTHHTTAHDVERDESNPREWLEFYQTKPRP